MASRQEIVDKYFSEQREYYINKACKEIEADIEKLASSGEKFMIWALLRENTTFDEVKKIESYFIELGYITKIESKWMFFEIYIQW